jgi:hypothetical protein
MIFGKVAAALGDIATQIAYYRVFAGWFAPGGGFGTTIGLQIGIARIGGFVGSSTANVISKVRDLKSSYRKAWELTSLFIRIPETLLGSSGSVHASPSSQTCAHLSSSSLRRLHISAFARHLIQRPERHLLRKTGSSTLTRLYNCLGSSGRLCFSQWCRQVALTYILKMPLSLLSIVLELMLWRLVGMPLCRSMPVSHLLQSSTQSRGANQNI